MSMYRKYWDKMVNELSEDVVVGLLEKEIDKVKEYSRKQFGMCFGKKPLNQMRKGVVKSKSFSKWKGLKVSSQRLRGRFLIKYYSNTTTD